MEDFVRTHRAKCPHCLGDIEKHYREWGDWYFVCLDCKRIVPSAAFQYVPIAEHFNHVENNHMRKVTLIRVEAKDKREEKDDDSTLYNVRAEVDHAQEHPTRLWSRVLEENI